MPAAVRGFVVLVGSVRAQQTKDLPLLFFAVTPPLPRLSLILLTTRYNETFEFDVSNPASVLDLECWEEDTFSNNYIGAINIPLRELSDGNKVNLAKG